MTKRAANGHPLVFLEISQNRYSDQFSDLGTAYYRLAVALPAILLLVGGRRVQEAREHGGEFHGENELGGRAGSQRFEGFKVLKTHGFGINRVSHGVDSF